MVLVGASVGVPPAEEEQQEAGEYEKANMICPHCREDRMRTRKLKDVNVNVECCDKCGGIWFDCKELKRAIPEAVNDLRAPEGASKVRLLCPECLESLRRFQYPQTYVTIDMCSKCNGLWLDANEFQEIRSVRRFHKEQGELEPDPIHGVKGSLISFIEKAIQELND